MQISYNKTCILAGAGNVSYIHICIYGLKSHVITKICMILYNDIVYIRYVWYLCVLEFASIDLTSVRFTLTKGTGVPEKYVF